MYKISIKFWGEISAIQYIVDEKFLATSFLFCIDEGRKI